MAEERYYKHDGNERFTHWAHTVNTVFLVLSGLQIHYPGFSVFGAMQNARFLHIVSGYLFVALGVYHTYIFFALGKHKVSMPGLLDFSEVGPIVRYYLHIDRVKPAYEKYNVLQKFGYFLLFAVSVVQSLLGFALYWPAQFAAVFAVFGDAVFVRIWHTLIMWLFLSFTALHVYLVVTEDRRLVTAMVDGYYYRKAADGK
ncbi:MAG: cytochrome b/b6 domain-containing protein [Deltaproteobacteria bacterium]|nr:cytochrome b/b6 domain-containing protein [Deltaproteobacteria bacterium]